MQACPCCGYLTLQDKAQFEICGVCAWQDDGQDSHNADEALGGPNHLSLSEARKCFLIHKVSDLRFLAKDLEGQLIILGKKVSISKYLQKRFFVMTADSKIKEVES